MIAYSVLVCKVRTLVYLPMIILYWHIINTIERLFRVERPSVSEGVLSGLPLEDASIAMSEDRDPCVSFIGRLLRVLYLTMKGGAARAQPFVIGRRTPRLFNEDVAAALCNMTLRCASTFGAYHPVVGNLVAMLSGYATDASMLWLIDDPTAEELERAFMPTMCPSKSVQLFAGGVSYTLEQAPANNALFWLAPSFSLGGISRACAPTLWLVAEDASRLGSLPDPCKPNAVYEYFSAEVAPYFPKFQGMEVRAPPVCGVRTADTVTYLGDKLVYLADVGYTWHQAISRVLGLDASKVAKPHLNSRLFSNVHTHAYVTMNIGTADSTHEAVRSIWKAATLVDDQPADAASAAVADAPSETTDPLEAIEKDLSKVEQEPVKEEVVAESIAGEPGVTMVPAAAPATTAPAKKKKPKFSVWTPPSKS